MLYDEIINRVEHGAKCRVDFKERLVFLNGKKVETDGKDFGMKQFQDLDEWLDEVENLYDDYKYSKPTRRSMAAEDRSLFKALTASQLVEELGHDALGNPMLRSVAQARLEVFILLSLLNGTLNLDELFAKDWFFQGSDKSFVILKDWF
jgi:hypothetical protein